MAHSYAHLFALPVTGLRFFTVYGPWGRPDMSPMLFTKAILAGEPIRVFNEGRMRRDFTYVDDIVEGVVRMLARPPATDAGGIATAPAAIYNIGNNDAVELMTFIATLESLLGRRAVCELRADAARRHAGDLCVDRPPARRRRLRAAHAARGRPGALRRVVPRPFRRVSRRVPAVTGKIAVRTHRPFRPPTHTPP